jgi:hypothetical protein
VQSIANLSTPYSTPIDRNHNIAIRIAKKLQYHAGPGHAVIVLVHFNIRYSTVILLIIIS